MPILTKVLPPKKARQKESRYRHVGFCGLMNQHLYNEVLGKFFLGKEQKLWRVMMKERKHSKRGDETSNDLPKGQQDPLNNFQQ